MVQNWCEDYYELSKRKVCEGCCLDCTDSKPGCLCYECKCKKCYWYSPPEENGSDKGVCELVPILKEKRKQEFIKMKQEEEEIKYRELLALKKANQQTLKEIKEAGEIPNYYTCQMCDRQFVSKEEHNIILNKKPCCYQCEDKNGK